MSALHLQDVCALVGEVLFSCSKAAIQAPEIEWSQRLNPQPVHLILKFRYSILLKCRVSPFAGADADGLRNRRDKDLAVADRAGSRELNDHVDYFVCVRIGYD